MLNIESSQTLFELVCLTILDKILRKRSGEEILDINSSCSSLKVLWGERGEGVRRGGRGKKREGEGNLLVIAYTFFEIFLVSC